MYCTYGTLIERITIRVVYDDCTKRFEVMHEKISKKDLPQNMIGMQTLSLLICKRFTYYYQCSTFVINTREMEGIRALSLTQKQNLNREPFPLSL